MSNSVLRLYYVLLKSYEDLCDFYTDMETEGGSLYIPNRCVECPDRCPDSLITGYMLTDEEAEIIAKDPRVDRIELNDKDRGIDYVPLEIPAVQSSSKWDKGYQLDNQMLNWGLVRCTRDRPKLTGSNQYPNAVCLDTELSNFNNKPLDYKVLLFNKLKMAIKTSTSSTGGYTEQSQYWDLPSGIGSGNAWGFYNFSGTPYYKESITADVVLNSTGKHVDVVIIDGGALDPNHPEFQRNPDGTGGSRVVQYNWYQHSASLNLTTPAEFDYSLTTSNGQSRVESHAMHCAGTVAGVRLGWAKEANIYWIPFRQPQPDGSFSGSWPYAIKYVQRFHETKPINPATGKRNPTIVNNSWGTTAGGNFFEPSVLSSMSRISSITVNGTVYNKPTTGNFTLSQLTSFGLYPFTGPGYARSTLIDIFFREAMQAGVVCVCASGNSNYQIVDRNDINNNAKIEITGSAPAPTTVNGNQITFVQPGSYYYLGGLSPGASDDNDTRINVGALDVYPWDWKGSFSSTGKKVDLFAPGVNIISSYLNQTNVVNAVADSRNNSYYLQKLQGTSMATPQVTGIIACLAQFYPHWTNKEFKEFLINTAETGSIAEAPGTYNPNSQFSLQFNLKDSPNRIARYTRQRESTGITWPRQIHSYRGIVPDAGTYKGQYPRLKPARK